MTIALLTILTACDKYNEENTNEKAEDNPTPKEILADDENADIFFMDGTVYTNAENIEWVKKEDLTIGKEIGVIKNQTDNSEEFENFTASKLPIGTEIYEPQNKSGSIYIVKLNNEEIPYLGLVEG
ncbi:hypothetical protein QNH47_09605 [Virgibacillus halodenitrificans]|uniref:hypothetical protein n=1 Tax=Virgibacillus halodenitrificans TaxID=1482 RepID=UPI0024BF9573|nr:hypothetical protein [Virgibacillus halodenitrificans]WHX28080.1 hypothetical protein QNH47_09605 [Virgibacillus halodenitrificans]